MLNKLKDIIINKPKLNMFQFKAPQNSVLQAIYNQINGSLSNAYKQPLMKKYLSSLPTKTLLDQSVVMHVGSKTRPKNGNMRQLLLELAKQKATKMDDIHEQKRIKIIQQQLQKQKTEQTAQQQFQQNQGSKQYNLVKYYQAYFAKLAAYQSGIYTNFDLSTKNFLELVQKSHPLSCFLVGNQLFLKYLETLEEEQKILNCLNTCLELFNKSVTQNHFGGLLHIGQILQKQILQGVQTSDQQIQEFFVYSAAYGNALAYYKLALLYKKKGNIKLYIKYLKQAAEKGVLQGQHDLAAEYLQGKNLKKDQLKAFSWFVNCGAHNFVQSKYNAALMLLNGSSCGRILPNKKAALIYFQQINKSGLMDVSSQIKSLLQDQQLQQELKQQNQQNKSAKQKHQKGVDLTLEDKNTLQQKKFRVSLYEKIKSIKWLNK